MSLVARKLHVIQGEHSVSADPAVIMTTVLGSCVSACLHDPVTGVGGMNHFLLAEDAGGDAMGDEIMRYGAYAMEVLINDLMKIGARRERLQAKLFGGARLFDSLGDIGGANAAFARRFLETEGVALTGGSLGGTQARRIEFWPALGRARQRSVDQAPELARAPVRTPAPAVGGVELF
jgi:chemotaxis protein CheD